MNIVAIVFWLGFVPLSSATLGGYVVYRVMLFLHESIITKELGRRYVLAADYERVNKAFQELEALHKVHKETPAEWRERNLKTKHEQLEHEICASEVAYQRHIDKLTCLKKIRDAAIQAHPDLRNDIEVGFEVYRRTDAGDVPNELAVDEERY